MSSHAQAGSMTRRTIALALFKAHVDASDEELRELNITRDEVLFLAREYLSVETGYGDVELATMFVQVAHAFVAGKNKR